MRSFVCLLAVLSFISGGSAACFAQRPAGPRTLENLLNSEAAEKPAAAAEVAGTVATDAGPKRPAGTVARPKDGVQHPDLDKAWADYDAAIMKAAEGIRAAINKQFDAATAKGDLDESDKWLNSLEKFEKTGDVPMEKETKAAVGAAVADYKKARNDLAVAYEALVKTLTKEKKLTEARAARDESQGLENNTADLRDIASLPDRRKELAVAAREFSVTLRLTSDWGTVTLHPASAVEIGKQEVLRGGQPWKITGNKIELGGQPFRRNDSTVTVMCRLKDSSKELIIETHKGDIGAIYVEAVSRGKVLGQFPNEGSHGGNAQRSDSCRQDFRVVVP